MAVAGKGCCCLKGAQPFPAGPKNGEEIFLMKGMERLPEFRPVKRLYECHDIRPKRMLELFVDDCTYVLMMTSIGHVHPTHNDRVIICMDREI